MQRKFAAWAVMQVFLLFHDKIKKFSVKQSMTLLKCKYNTYVEHATTN